MHLAGGVAAAFGGACEMLSLGEKAVKLLCGWKKIWT